jgi:hypothetical protein
VASSALASDTQLLKAFATVESRNRPQVLGDKGLAWGLYQFHQARYEELGGQNYGSASIEEQNRVMLIELAKVRKLNKKKIDFIRAAATYHNNGHIKNIETAYVAKVRALTK